MKIKRFTAPDMRQALRMVREVLGDDAVILSNKSVDGGVELTAAVDLPTEEGPVQAPPMSFRTSPGTASGPRRAAPERGPRARAAVAAPADDAADVPAQALQEMREEMQRMRRWLQAEISSMSWHDLTHRAPGSSELLQRLTSLGLTADLVHALSERVGDAEELQKAWRKALYFLSGELRIHDQDLLERGGVVALVGPTGVGKTTTIAKMAARFALRHGHRNVALVTTDNFRIGARDQLHTYGRILNVPVRSVTDADNLADTVSALSDRRLVLIDTAGMAAEDERFALQIETLQGLGRELTTLLTLSATTESAALQKAIALFSEVRPDACVLTKLDEAASLGAVLSAVIHSELPLAYLADGQRVPEDLQQARAQPLVNRAAELLDAFSPDCDQTYMALSYRRGDADARI